MRILQISSARSFGGGEQHLVDLTNGLADRGHDIFIALSHESPIGDRIPSVTPEQIFSLRLRNAFDLKSAFQLSRIVREHQIEIVHAHMARDYPLGVLAVRKNTQARLVLTRHVLFPLGKLHSVTAGKVARVIAVSDAVARALKSQNIFSPESIRTVNNGMDFSRVDAALRHFDRRATFGRLGIDETRRLVVSVGELNPLKGHEEFIRAAALVAARCPDADFLVVGEDRTQNRENLSRLEGLCAESGLARRVHFTGWVDDLASLLIASDVFVSASRTESFGLAILEAMACGSAIVATRTEGAQELLADAESGHLVEIGDVNRIAERIVRLLSDSRERKALGESASCVAREHFGLERMVEETEVVYREALAV